LLLLSFFAEVDFSVTDFLIKKSRYDRAVSRYCKALELKANEKRIIKKELFFIKISLAQHGDKQVNRLGSTWGFKSIDLKPGRIDLSPSQLNLVLTRFY